MPKRSDRDKYKHAFDGNPFDGLSPEDIYRSLKWDNEPKELFDINAPEALVALGEVARIDLEDGHSETISEKKAPFLALGTDSNRLYIIHKDEYGQPIDVPMDFDKYEYIGEVTATHYYSDKGNEEAYYYHDHEEPYPMLYRHPKTGVCILVPQDMDGNPSYAVAREGIIG